MGRKTNDNIEEAVFRELKQGLSYSQIIKNHPGIGKATISRIKNRKDINLEIDKPSKPTIYNRRQLKEGHVRAAIVRQADALIVNLLDVIPNLQHVATRMMSIIDKSEEKAKSIEDDLHKVFEIANEKIAVDPEDMGEVKQKEKLLQAIMKAIASVGNFHIIHDIIIKASKEFRGAQEDFVEIEVFAKNLMDIKELLDAIFLGMNVLSDTDYQKYKRKVLELHPAAGKLFAAHENMAEEAGTDNNQQE